MGCRSDKCDDRVKPRSGGILLAVGVSPRNPEISRRTGAASGGIGAVLMSPFQGLKRNPPCVHVPWADAHG